VREFQDRINRQSPYIRARYTSHEQKKEFLDSLVRFEVLAKEAHARGFDKDPDVVRTMKQVMIQKLMKEQFDEKLGPESITDEEMKKFFDEHQSEFNKPEEVRVSAVIVKSKKEADEVAKAAQTETGKTNKGFRDLVTKHSVDSESKLRGGDLRYFAADSKEIPKPVVDGAFKLVNTGDTSPAIDAGNGTFYVLKQTGRRKAVTKTFEQVKRQIQNRLYRDKRTDSQKTFIDGLRQKAKIEVFDDNLGKVRIDQSAEVTGDPRAGGHGGVGTGVDDVAPEPAVPQERESTD
jgi:peptidyl-prolyl cis-trans isomerase C